MNSTESSINIPLGRKAHATAEEFAALQVTPQKGKRVYLNTLAVYAVHSYLKWLQVDSELGQSDSWNSGLQSLSDLADLVISEIGLLECRSVLPGETFFAIPPQAKEDRIGYVAVRFEANLERAELLGFLPAIATSNNLQQIPLTSLQPLDTLLDYLPTTKQIVQPSKITRKVPVKLSRWLENYFDAGWLSVETLFSSTRNLNSALVVRSRGQYAGDFTTIKRGKQIDLGTQVRKSIALIVIYQPTAEAVDICLQVYTLDSSRSLPPNLQLVVLDEMGNTVPELQVSAGSADFCIQLEFTGKLGEEFSVKLTFGDVEISEYFQI